MTGSLFLFEKMTAIYVSLNDHSLSFFSSENDVQKKRKVFIQLTTQTIAQVLSILQYAAGIRGTSHLITQNTKNTCTQGSRLLINLTASSGHS